MLWNVGVTLKKLGFANFALMQEVARDCPYSLNESATFQTALWIQLHQMLAESRLESKWDFVICDRSIYDEMPFYKSTFKNAVEMLKNTNYERIHFLQDIADKWVKLHPYKVIFLFRPIALQTDVDRNINNEYQQRINELFDEELDLLPNMIEVDGDFKTRENTVLKEILKWMRK